MKSPILFRRVEGHSMAPTLMPDDVVVAIPMLKPAIGAIVIARVSGMELIKRVESIEGGYLRLVGDNYYHSQDSRQFGPISSQQILGVVIGYPKTFNATSRSLSESAY